MIKEFIWFFKFCERIQVSIGLREFLINKLKMVQLSKFQFLFALTLNFNWSQFFKEIF